MKIVTDSPNAQSGALGGVLNIGGWIIDQIASISKVSVSVDGVPFGDAAYGGDRSDVCKVFQGAIGCPNIGWNFPLYTTLLADGAHNLEITATTNTGRSSTSTTAFTVLNSGSVPIKVSIDTPSVSETLSQLAAIGGWALDTNGQAIQSVEILVDGISVGNANYDGNRPDVCAIFPSGGGCPNVGWNYVLDTTGFANGTHTLEARATAADSQVYTARQSFNVVNEP